MRLHFACLAVVAASWLASGAAAAEPAPPLPSPAALTQALAEKDVDQVRAALAPFGRVASVGKEHRPVLRAALASQDARVRVYAALGLSASGEHDEAVVREILAALATRKASYLIEDDLIAELGLRAQGVKTMPVLLAALQHESSGVRYHALAVIESIGPAAREALPLVVRQIESPELARHAVMAKWRIDGDAEFAVAKLVSLLPIKRERQCNGAADCLARLGPRAKEAVPALIAAMREHKDYAVIEALHELCPHDPERIIAAFRAGLDDPELADGTAAALVSRDGPRDYLLPHLARMMNGEGDRTIERHELARVLGGYGPAAAPAVPGLIRTLTSPSGQTRINAAEALGKIGPGAKEALPALRKALGDQDAAAAAEQAIKLIEGTK